MPFPMNFKREAVGERTEVANLFLLPRQGEEDWIVYGGIVSKSAFTCFARCFNRLQMRFPNSLAVSLLPLNVKFGFGFLAETI
jgi:hypothetical protein